MFKLIINGQERCFSHNDFPENVSLLLDCLSLDPGRVVAEVNGNIVESATFAVFKLNNNDVIELVQFVGGG